MVLLPDSDVQIVLNDDVLNWQTLIVLANSENSDIRCATLRLFNSYLERAPVKVVPLTIFRRQKFFLGLKKFLGLENFLAIFQCCLLGHKINFTVRNFFDGKKCYLEREKYRIF